MQGVECRCGTGQATVPLAQRGLAVTAVEVGAALAAIARRRLAGFPLARVLTGSFEDWECSPSCSGRIHARLDHARFIGQHHRLYTISKPQLGEHACDVSLDGTLTE
jgi:hypothetical protein